MKNNENDDLKKKIDDAIKDLESEDLKIDGKDLKKQVDKIVEEINDEEKQNEKVANDYEENAEKVDYNNYEETPKNVDYNNYDTEEAKENAKDDKKKINLIVVFMIFIGVILFSLVVFNFNNISKEKEEKKEIIIKEADTSNIKGAEVLNTEKIYSNIEFEIKEDYLGNKMLFIKSNREEDLNNIDLYIIYKDENDKIIKINSINIEYIPAGETITTKLEYMIYEYEDYEVFFEEESTGKYSYYDYYTYTNKGLEFSNIVKGEYDEITYDVSNLASEKIEDASYTVLLYNDKEVVYFEENYVFELGKNKNDEKTIWLDDEIEYTDVKFIINYIRFEK